MHPNGEMQSTTIQRAIHILKGKKGGLPDKVKNPVKNPPAMFWEDSMEKEMATHSSLLA